VACRFTQIHVIFLHSQPTTQCHPQTPRTRSTSKRLRRLRSGGQTRDGDSLGGHSLPRKSSLREATSRSRTQATTSRKSFGTLSKDASRYSKPIPTFNDSLTSLRTKMSATPTAALIQSWLPRWRNTSIPYMFPDGRRHRRPRPPTSLAQI
jgi:hypothetical protein